MEEISNNYSPIGINKEETYMPLTKLDLINKVHSSSSKLTKNMAREAVETILQTMKVSLENGDDILLSGFGKFNVRAKSERKGRNPQTTEPVVIEARNVVTFKPSKLLRDKVNGK